MKNYINNDSLFTVVNVPYSNTLYSFAIIKWLATKGSPSEYKQIYDREAFKSNFTITQYMYLYPGVKTIAVVSNPWRRVFDIYIDEISKLNSIVPNDFNLFVEQLYSSKLPRGYLQSAHLNTEDGVTTDYIFRVENIENEFKEIQTFFLNDTPLQKVTLCTSYISEYSDRSKRLVEEMFKEDISQFGYTWEQ